MKRIGKSITGILSAALLVSNFVVPGSVVFADTKVEINAKNFPDDRFREEVAWKDKNEDGWLDQEEIDNITDLNLSPFGLIESVKGIELLSNLQYLECRNNKITEIDLSQNTKLKGIECYDNKLTSLDVSNNPDLEWISCGFNKIDKLDLSNNTKLTIVYCPCSELTELDVSKQNLTHLICSNNKISKLTLNNVIDLECSYNELESLDISKCKDLWKIECNNNKLKSLDFSNCKDASVLVLGHNQLTELDVSGLPNLMFLNCMNNQLESLDVSKNVDLWTLECENNKLTSLDFSKNKKLARMSVFGNNIDKLDVSSTRLSEPGIFNIYDDSDRSKIITDKIIYSETDDYFCMSDDIMSYLKYREMNTDPEYIEEIFGYKDLNGEKLFVNSYYFVVGKSTVVTGTSFDMPSPVPTEVATPTPTAVPTTTVTSTPSPIPTATPTAASTVTPTIASTAVPTSEATVAPTESTTTSPTEVPTEEPAKAETVDDFAERLYTTCLGRDAEADGKEYWASELKSGKTGAEVAEGFFFSPEYDGRKLDNKAFINTLYETFMGRNPADAEVAYWSSEMDNGKTRKDIFDGFVNSPEWANICLTYGIRSGGLAAPTFEKEASPEVKSFAERLYTTCLGRDAEEAGLDWWSLELANLRQTGTVAAQGFFFSEEFVKLKTDNKEYVTRLYKTFMGREPEAEGFKYWVGELDNGKSRQDVFDGFSVAPEFADLCAKAGIMR